MGPLPCCSIFFCLFVARLCVLTDMVSSPLVYFVLLHCCRDFLCQALCFDTVSSRLFRFGLLHCCRDFLCQALCFDTVSSQLFRFGLLYCCRNFLCQVLCFDRHGQFSTCPLWATALLYGFPLPGASLCTFLQLCVLKDMVSSPLVHFGPLPCCMVFLCQVHHCVLFFSSMF